MEKIVLCGIAMASVAYFLYLYTHNKPKKYLVPRDYIEKYGSVTPQNKFYVYNYYKVPITVTVSEKEVIDIDHTKDFPTGVGNNTIPATVYEKKPKDSNLGSITLVENVQPGKFGVVTDNKWKNITDNKKVQVYRAVNSIPDELIGESIMTIPQGKTIKALHCGMVSAHTDISISGDITKSPLGTALPRLRIVNVTPRTINLTTTGGNKLTIPAGKSLLYFGEYENGVPLGVTFKDIDGVLPDYNVKIPCTDLFLGIISDIEIPLYRNSRIGGEFFDIPGIMYHPFEELPGYQLHRGAFIDKSYIPKNW